MRLPLGYTEKIGRCTLKKVRDYGYKYRVYYGASFHQCATIGKAREFALADFHRHANV